MTNGATQKMQIEKEAICLSLKLGRLRTRRKVNTSSVETDADPEMVHVAKDILESKELDAIRQFHGEIKRYIRARALPSPFRKGIHLLRLAMVKDVMTQLDAYEGRFWQLVETFMAYYATVHAQRHDPNSPLAKQLGSLYEASDYPDPKKVKRAFQFEVQLWELATPGALRTLDRALYEREAEKMQNVWEDAKQQITQVLLSEFRKLTARMAESLTPGPDGKPKRIYDSLVGNLEEWLDLFDKRSLTNDKDLLAYVKQVRAMVSGIKPDTLRESEDLRKEIAEEMQKVTANLDKAIEERPGRCIDLDDEEEVNA